MSDPGLYKESGIPEPLVPSSESGLLIRWCIPDLPFQTPQSHLNSTPLEKNTRTRCGCSSHPIATPRRFETESSNRIYNRLLLSFFRKGHLRGERTQTVAAFLFRAKYGNRPAFLPSPYFSNFFQEWFLRPLKSLLDSIAILTRARCFSGFGQYRQLRNNIPKKRQILRTNL